MPSNKANEPPYFRPNEQRKDSDGKGQRIEKRADVAEICLQLHYRNWRQWPDFYTCTAIVAELQQFAKLLDLVSNAEIVEFGETRAMRYRNWDVGCTEE